MVAAFLVALCPNTLCMRHQDRQMAALPVCPPDNGEVILFPKPENCSEFYQCAGGVLFMHRCQANLYYCEEKQYCSWPTDPDCKFDCVITKTNLVHAAEEFVPVADPVCPPETENVTFIGNPNNCSEFWGCDNGVPILMSCPGDLYFCSEKNICDWIWDPECKFDCVITKTNLVPAAKESVSAADPVCPPETGNLTLLANPNNCSEFFECDNGVPVPMGCPDGLYFCSEKQLCSWVWDPECIYDCTIVKSKPVIVEEKFDAIYERDDETTTVDDTTTVEPTDGPTFGTTAVPVCPPETENATFIANPNNCSEFWGCENGVPTLMSCPGGLYFCSEKNICDWIWDPECKFDCVITKTNLVPAAKEFVSAADPVCPPETGNVTFIANPNNCSEFWGCDNGEPVLMSCPGGLYFCSEKDICAWVWDPECKFDCSIAKSKNVIVEEKVVPAAVPTCPPQVDDIVTYLPDPDDCNRYYECSNGVAVPMRCPDNLYFCSQKNSCDWIWDPECRFDCNMGK